MAEHPGWAYREAEDRPRKETYAPACRLGLCVEISGGCELRVLWNKVGMLESCHAGVGAKRPGHVPEINRLQ